MSRLWWIGGGLALAWLLAGAGCKQQQCDPPDQTVYSCQPLPAGSSGCKGGPAFGNPSGGARDPDKVFPLGCSVQLPFCLFDSPTSFQTCQCREAPAPRDAGADGGADGGGGAGADGGAAPGWVCSV